MKHIAVIVFAVMLLTGTGGQAFAGEGHDQECMGCHNMHYAKGDYAMGVAPYTKVNNPARTKAGNPAESIDALCLGCHNENEGIKPINFHTTHPTGITPTSNTKVPPKLLWDGKLTCVSCHNPHPSNVNYRYLVMQTNKGADMGVFCAKCHPEQSAPETVKKAESAPIHADIAGPPIVKVQPPVKAPVEEKKPAAPFMAPPKKP